MLQVPPGAIVPVQPWLARAKLPVIVTLVKVTV